MEIFTAFAGELERSIAWGSGGFYYPWWCGSPGTEKYDSETCRRTHASRAQSWTVRGDGCFYYPWWCGSPGTEKEISLLSGMLVKATL